MNLPQRQRPQKTVIPIIWFYIYRRISDYVTVCKSGWPLMVPCHPLSTERSGLDSCEQGRCWIDTCLRSGQTVLSLQPVLLAQPAHSHCVRCPLETRCKLRCLHLYSCAGALPFSKGDVLARVGRAS